MFPKSVLEHMVVEKFIALIVSTLLSNLGVPASANGDIIYVPSLDHSFIVLLSCTDWVGVFLWVFIYVFAVWVYVELNGRSMRRRGYLFLGLVGFFAFFCANILRIFTEIFLVSTVYSSVYKSYLLSWQAFEEQVGMGLMFATFFMLFVVSYLFLEKKWKGVIPSSLRFEELKKNLSS